MLAKKNHYYFFQHVYRDTLAYFAMNPALLGDLERNVEAFVFQSVLIFIAIIFTDALISALQQMYLKQQRQVCSIHNNC